MTLDCPSDCPYLRQAHEHEKPRSADQIDAAELFLEVELSDQFMYEQEHLLMGLTYALAKAARADRSLRDHDLLATLSVLAKSYQRRVNSGLHYEQPLTSASQRRVAAEVENMVKEYREAEQKHVGYSNLRESTCSKRWCFSCDWHMAGLRAGQNRGPSWNFSSRSFPRKIRLWSPPRKLAAGSSCPRK